MTDSKLILHFDELQKSNESYFTTLLGLLTVQVGFALVIRYLERISKTKNLLTVYVNQPSKNVDISRQIIRMKYGNSPVHIKSINQMLTTCQKCVEQTLKSSRSLDLPKVADLLRECGYDFDVTEHLSKKDVNSRKAAVIALTTAMVSLISIASNSGTVSGATCATVAIGLFGARAVDTQEAATPRLYGEVGIKSANDVLAACKQWLAVYNGLEKIQQTRYELPALEYKLLKKIVGTVGETLRFTGMALRSYVEYL